MYQALYRKWRPKTFSQVVGQDHITGTLQRQVAEGRTAHAYLFTGTRGTGKTTCARILAKAVNCLHPEDGAPCNQCEACRGIDSGSLLDVTELDAASNSRVDDIRELLSESVYTPTVLKKRVYIIDEVHMLSTQAFNALLKTIEEPPEHLMFILATTELHKVPATILSRCQRFTFKRILPRDMEKHLLEIARAEQIDLTPDGAEILARMANGALRDALSLLDQCSVVAAHFQTPAKDGGTKTGTNFGTDGTNTGNQTFVALAKLLLQIFHDVGCKGEDGCNVGCQRCAMECGRYKYENRIQLLGTNETDDAADHANNCKDQQNIALSVFGKHFGRKCHDDNSDKNGNDRNKRVHISIAEHIAGEVDCGREENAIDDKG